MSIPSFELDDVNQLNENINMKILKEEILEYIKKLKNNKFCGEDLVINIDYYITYFISYPLSALGHDISTRVDRLDG
jgi:hypothetical protein